jgi:NAD(P)-dependent dehydrogenase (short-subunit alcohol dehydrogenase family)
MIKSNWTTNNIPDLTGKVIIVTGGNSGLGYEAVKAFAKKGAKVYMTSRSIEKGQNAQKQILDEVSDAAIEVAQLNLADLSSVRKFANEFAGSEDRLDVLLNNAGIMMTPYSVTADGFENQFGTNHLGHFALTGLLMKTISKTPESRIVNVSSIAHKGGSFDFNDLLYSNGKTYDPMKAYRRSKLANLLFTYELQRRLSSAGNGTIAAAAHPGVSMTNLANHLTNNLLLKILTPIVGLLLHSPAQGALPEIRAAVDPSVQGGQYFGPDGWREMKGNPVLVESNKASHNEDDAKKLWEVSEQLTGVKFKL